MLVLSASFMSGLKELVEPVLVYLSENASIGAKGWRYVFALNEKAYGADEEALESLALVSKSRT
jgi:hypothetical protein